jgi:N-methylhydantoinase B
MAEPGPDGITREVIRHALVATADEMKETLGRSAYNPIINEVLDFSCGVFDARGRLAAQAAGLTIFLGTLDWAVQAVLDKRGADRLEPGDLFLTNDPYDGGGTHLNDVCAVAPVFHDEHLLGFVASRAHWTDVGGAVPMSVQPDAREVYAEGLILPVVRLVRGGAVDTDLLDLLRANVRDPETQLGDLRAQLAAADVGARRLDGLASRYGADGLQRAIADIQDMSERLVRRRLANLDDFETDAEDFLDDDGVGGDPARIRVRVSKQGDELTMDFSGSAPSNPSGYNMGLCSLVSACRVVFKAVIDPDSHANDGGFRPLSVVAPPGSVVNARSPSAVSLYGEPARRAIDAVWRAVGESLTGTLPAGHFGTIAGIAMAGLDDRVEPPRRTTYQGPNVGGWGAAPGCDGESALCCVTNGDTRNTPAEVIETKAPLRVHRLALRPDSGGRGEWRGGLGIVYEYEILTGGPFTMTCALGRTDFPPFGSAGGNDGATNLIEVRHADGTLAHLKRTTAYPLARGDRVIVLTGGGGGYGDPARRDQKAAELDGLRGYVSRESADRPAISAGG